MQKHFASLILLFLCSVVVYATPITDNTPSTSPTSYFTFKENKGQIMDQYGSARSDIHFQLESNNASIFIGRGSIHYQWNHCGKQETQISDTAKGIPQKVTVNTYRLDMELLGADVDASIIKEKLQSDYDLYYAQGLNGVSVHSYKKITYRNIYPNIDWVLYVKDNNLKYDFIVHPGGKVGDIKIRYNGATDIALKEGAVVVATPMGSITEQQPFSYLSDNGHNIPSHFVLNKNILEFEVGTYQGTLIIDPELRLQWSTYYGGSGAELGMYIKNTFQGYLAYGNTVTTDHSGNVYMSGTTTSLQNIATIGTHQSTFTGGNNNNAYLVKFNQDGQRLWGTYFGGYNGAISLGTVSGRGHSIACDTIGNIYMTGNTWNDSGIATVGAYQATLSDIGYSTGWPDLYLAKFNTNGTREWATYLGNPGPEEGGSVAVTPDGSKIYLAGASKAVFAPGVDAIASSNAFIPPVFLNNSVDFSGFLTRFNPSGQREWGTYIGDASYINSTVYDIALDQQGCIYLTGSAIGDGSSSATSMASAGTFQPFFGGCLPGYYQFCPNDAFLQKWDSTGNRLWGSYYGGNYHDGGYAVACDDNGDVYMAGYTDPFTSSINGIYSVASQGSFIDTYPVDGGSFLAKFSGQGQRLWATYYQGNGSYFFGSCTALACKDNKVFLLANTSVSNIATPCAYQTINPSLYANGSAGYSAHIAIFSPSGTREYATYFGGQFEDWGSSLATIATPEGMALYMTGTTMSPSGIATPGSYKSALGSLVGFQKDAFLAKFMIPVAEEMNVPCFSQDSLLISSKDTTGSNYNWNNGATGHHIWVKNSATYIVYYLKTDGCPSSDTLKVAIYPMPQLTTQKACTGNGEAQVKVQEDNLNNYTYKWYKESGELIKEKQSNNGDVLSGLNPGNYKLQLLGGTCDTTITFTIEAFPEVPLAVSNDTIVLAGSSVPLWVSGANHYQWEPEQWLDFPTSDHPVSRPETSIIYTVTGYNEYGCKGTRKIRIDISEQLLIPNAFSPNGDGQNDEFKLVNFGYRKLIAFHVFNRWGEEVFSTTNPNTGWKGDYKGKPSDAGIYYYSVVIINTKNLEETFKGDLTLIR